MAGRPEGAVIAVTGAHGLIGRATVTALTGLGLRVRGYSGPERLRPIPGRACTSPAPLSESDFVWGDLMDPAVLAQAFEGASVVVHLAGPPSVSHSFVDPAGAVAAHAAGTAAVVQAALRQGAISRIVIASSAEVYGIPQSDRVGEDHPLGPLSPYAAGKVGAEAVAQSLTRPLGVELVVLRPFAVYGPHSPSWSLVASTMRQAITGGPITLQSLDRVRDLVHVADVAAAFAAAATRPLRQSSLVLNVCTGVATSVEALARTALAVSGSNAGVSQAAARPEPNRADLLAGARPDSSDPIRLVGDPSRAASELGWTARTDLATGLVGLLETLRAGR